MIAIVDYGMGNLRSAQKGLEKAGHEAIISDDARAIREADGVVLPGVGSFAHCFRALESNGFVDVLHEVAAEGRPILGICVGMQLLFEESDEGEGSQGLGLLRGKVVRFAQAKTTGLKVPHMGWNLLKPVEGRPCTLLEGVDSEPYVYFVHSYYPRPADDAIVYATTEYGEEFASVVLQKNVMGTQFHPEKSQAVGIAILRAFGDIVRASRASAALNS